MLLRPLNITLLIGAFLCICGLIMARFTEQKADSSQPVDVTTTARTSSVIASPTLNNDPPTATIVDSMKDDETGTTISGLEIIAKIEEQNKALIAIGRPPLSDWEACLYIMQAYHVPQGQRAARCQDKER